MAHQSGIASDSFTPYSPDIKTQLFSNTTNTLAVRTYQPALVAGTYLAETTVSTVSQGSMPSPNGSDILGLSFTMRHWEEGPTDRASFILSAGDSIMQNGTSSTAHELGSTTVLVDSRLIAASFLYAGALSHGVGFTLSETFTIPRGRVGSCYYEGFSNASTGLTQNWKITRISK